MSLLPHNPLVKVDWDGSTRTKKELGEEEPAPAHPHPVVLDNKVGENCSLPTGNDLEYQINSPSLCLAWIEVGLLGPRISPGKHLSS